MKTSILDDLTTKKQTCYFISPHFDDMIFSAGALASELSKTNEIIVINIFTAAGQPHTLSAKAYLKQCEYTDAQKLYQDRSAEDKDALQGLADKVINLGFSEALWRKEPGKLPTFFGRLIPELGSIYPTYRFNIIKGTIAQADLPLVDAIKKKLKALIPDQSAVVFCPLGVGNHIDHVITHVVCKELFANPIYWADYPYTLSNTPIPHEMMSSFSYSENMGAKAKLVSKYKTQYKAMFGTSEPSLEPERFYTQNSHQ
jgi:LmbE family N-acetylglucosaminyl deacetylase